MSVHQVPALVVASASTADGPQVHIPQYSRRSILGVWAAAAAPMAALAWLVAPHLATTLSGPAPLGRALIVLLGIGMVWQFVLVAGLVFAEQRTLRWSVVRQALWLQKPRSPRSGRVGGRLWLLLIPLIVGLAAEELIPQINHPMTRDFGAVMGTHSFQTFLHGNWAWFAIIMVEMIFNTVLGEELLFRGFLLPRMNGAFGERDWLANGLLFALYHLHVPWVIPSALIDSFLLAYPSKRYRSAWIGICVHSAQTVVLGLGVFALVV
jgi:membrane protease YdiL (CAAX protease family)